MNELQRDNTHKVILLLSYKLAKGLPGRSPINANNNNIGRPRKRTLLHLL